MISHFWCRFPSKLRCHRDRHAWHGYQHRHLPAELLMPWNMGDLHHHENSGTSLFSIIFHMIDDRTAVVKGPTPSSSSFSSSSLPPPLPAPDPNTCQIGCQTQCQKECHKKCQIECQKDCQIECQNI